MSQKDLMEQAARLRERERETNQLRLKVVEAATLVERSCQELSYLSESEEKGTQLAEIKRLRHDLESGFHLRDSGMSGALGVESSPWNWRAGRKEETKAMMTSVEDEVTWKGEKSGVMSQPKTHGGPGVPEEVSR